MVDREEARLREVARRFGAAVGEEVDRPRTRRTELSARAVDEVVGVRQVEEGGVELAAREHLTDVGVGRDVLQVDADRLRVKARRASVAALGRPLHEPRDLLRVDAELVLEDATRPQCRCLLVLRDSDPPPVQLLGCGDPGLLRDEHPGMEEHPRGEDREAHPGVVAVRARHQQARHRHLGELELLEGQLAPEDFRAVDARAVQRDSLCLHLAGEDRAGAGVGTDREAQFEVSHLGPFSS